MATTEIKPGPALVLYCAFAQREGMTYARTLRLFRERGGHCSSLRFSVAWEYARQIPEAFGMAGVEIAAHAALRDGE